MKAERLGRFLVLSLVIFFWVALSACAAEEGGATGSERATELFKWINFAIIAGLLGWVFLKLTPPFFRNNAETIRSSISKASAAKAEADRLLQEAEQKLKRLEQEVAQLRAAAQREASAEAERIRSLAHRDVEKIGAAAKAEIEAAERAARMELKAIAAKLAIEGAESLLAKQLTPQVQESLVAGFVQGLEGRRN